MKKVRKAIFTERDADYLWCDGKIYKGEDSPYCKREAVIITDSNMIGECLLINVPLVIRDYILERV